MLGRQSRSAMTCFVACVLLTSMLQLPAPCVGRVLVSEQQHAAALRGAMDGSAQRVRSKGATPDAEPAPLQQQQHRKLQQFLPFGGLNRLLPPSGFLPFGGSFLNSALGSGSSGDGSNEGTATTGGPRLVQFGFDRLLPFFDTTKVQASNTAKWGNLFQVETDIPEDPELLSVLYSTNTFRSKHGLPGLKWNKQYALDVADIAKSCGGKAPSNDDVEDNVAWGYFNFEAAAKAWYDEGANFDYSATTMASGTQHFVRLLWREAREVGCAYSLSCRMYICRYSPVNTRNANPSEHVARPQDSNSG